MTVSLFDLKKKLSPRQFANAIKDKGPICWWEGGKFWLITDGYIAKDILQSKKVTCDRSPFFISRMPNIDLSLLQDFFSVVSQMMVMKDNGQHQASRRICYYGFSNQQINQLKPKIEQTINELLVPIKQKNSFDFCSEYADIIPMKTLADFFQIPEQDRHEFVGHAKLMTGFFGGASSYTNEAAKEVNHCAKTLKLYFQDLYLERSKSPKDDFFSMLIQHQNAFGLSQDDIIAQAIMMWVAGMTTTSDQMSNNCYTLVNDFPEYARDNLCLEQFLPLTEECSRLDPAVTFTFRLAAEDMVIQDQLIKQGETIFISNHAVNRDDAFFKSPDNIDLSRKEKHFSYGNGPHFCLGAKLATIEMQMAFYHLLKALPHLQIEAYERLHYSLSFSGFKTLMLRKDRV